MSQRENAKGSRKKKTNTSGALKNNNHMKSSPRTKSKAPLSPRAKNLKSPSSPKAKSKSLSPRARNLNKPSSPRSKKKRLSAQGAVGNRTKRKSATKMKKKEKEIVFQTGPMGLVMDGNLVHLIKGGSQAEKLGVVAGWIMLKIDNTAVGNDAKRIGELLKQRSKSNKPTTIMFEITSKKSVTMKQESKSQNTLKKENLKKENQRLKIENAKLKADIEKMRVLYKANLTEAEQALKSSINGSYSLSSASKAKTTSTISTSEEHTINLIRAQAFIRGWLVRRRFRKFVKMCSDPVVSKAIRKRNETVCELVKTEKSYLKGLEETVLQFMTPMKSSGLVDINDINKIFTNIGTLLIVHREFYEKIQDGLGIKKGESCSENNTNKNSIIVLSLNIGRMFLDLVPRLDCYMQYVSQYCFAQETLEEIAQKNQDLKNILPGGSNWNGELLKRLITPIQRIPRYVLLLKQIMKLTTSEFFSRDELVQATLEVQRVADEINLGATHEQGRYRLRELLKVGFENPIDDLLLPIIKCGWGFVKESTLGISSWHERFLILRGDLLFCFKKKNSAGPMVSWKKTATWYISLMFYSYVKKQEFKSLVTKKKKASRHQHQIWFYENENPLSPKKQKIGVAYKIAFHNVFELDDWAEGFRDGKETHDSGVYKLSSLHRQVIKEGNMMLFYKYNQEKKKLYKTPMSSKAMSENIVLPKDAICFLFNDMFFACTKNKKYFVHEVIHLPTIFNIHEHDKIVGQQTYSFTIQSSLVSRECVVASSDELNDWVIKFKEQQQHYKQSQKIRKGRPGSRGTLKSQLELLKREIFQTKTERQYYQNRIVDLVDQLYIIEERTHQYQISYDHFERKSSHMSNLPTINDEDNSTIATTTTTTTTTTTDATNTDPEHTIDVDDGEFKEKLEQNKIILEEAKREIKELREQIDRFMENLAHSNQNLSKLVKRNDQLVTETSIKTHRKITTSQKEARSSVSVSIFSGKEPEISEGSRESLNLY